MSPKEARKQYPNDFADDAVYEIVAQVKNQRNTVMKYQNTTGVLKAIRTENIDLNTISTYDCKDELFIKDENADILFSAYYRSHNACTDVCTLLGLSKPIIRPQDVLKIGKNRTAGKPLINHQQIKTARRRLP